MLRSETLRHGRRAFTLVELLVVITIIAVLVTLTTAGIQAVRKTMPRTQNQSDITKLAEALERAAVEYGRVSGEGPRVFPSRLILYNDLSSYSKNWTATSVVQDALTKRSAQTLRQMFGRNFLRNNSTQ